jgi:hypothetical protein
LKNQRGWALEVRVQFSTATEEFQGENAMRNMMTTIFTGLAFTLTPAMAQNAPTKLVAKVTFPFLYSGKAMSAGVYEITPIGNGARGYAIANREGGQGVLMIASHPTRESKDVAPRLVFQCPEDGTCELNQVWYGDSSHGYFAPKSKLSPRDKERLVAVNLTTVKAE